MKKDDNKSLQKEINTNDLFSNPMIKIENNFQCTVPICIDVVNIQDFLPKNTQDDYLLNLNNTYEYIEAEEKFEDIPSRIRNEIVNNYYNEHKKEIERSKLEEKDVRLKKMRIDSYKYHYYYTRKCNLKLNEEGDYGSYYKEIDIKGRERDHKNIKSFVTNPTIKKQLSRDNLRVMKDFYLNSKIKKERVREWIEKDVLFNRDNYHFLN